MLVGVAGAKLKAEAGAMTKAGTGAEQQQQDTDQHNSNKRSKARQSVTRVDLDSNRVSIAKHRSGGQQSWTLSSQRWVRWRWGQHWSRQIGG